MYRKNTAGQYITFVAINATTGAAMTGLTIGSFTKYRSIDGSGGSMTGTISETANGQYSIALSQADTNGNNIGYNITYTGMIPVNINIVTDGNPPDVNAAYINRVATTSVTNVMSYIGTTGASTAQTGDGYAIVNDTNFGNAKLVRSTTPANTLSVDTSHLVAVPNTQKVDLETIKTNPVVNAGTVTFPTTATLASTTNITAGTITTTTNLTNLPSVPTDWLAAAGVKADAVTKIQNGLATPTNITAGMITTVGTTTNLTNLPAVPTDWLAASGVKADAVTKIQNGLATPTNITAGTITTVTNLTNAPTNGDLTPTMKSSVTAAVPTANAIADAYLDRTDAIQTGVTPRQAHRIEIAGAGAGVLSGAATTTVILQNSAGTKTRVTATVDANGNRSAITMGDLS